MIAHKKYSQEQVLTKQFGNIYTHISYLQWRNARKRTEESKTQKRATFGILERPQYTDYLSHQWVVRMSGF